MTVALSGRVGQRGAMDLDALLYHYFGADDVDALTPAAIDEGRARVLIDFSTERDAGRRFALWSMLAALGDAPDPETAFKAPAERAAALRYVRALRSVDDGDG